MPVRNKDTDTPRGLGVYDSEKIKKEHQNLYNSCEMYAKNVILDVLRYAHWFEPVNPFWPRPCEGDNDISELCKICPYNIENG